MMTGRSSTSDRHSPGLGAMLLHGISWMGLVRAAAVLAMLARYVVFARLLTPYEFGVAGTGLLVFELLKIATYPNFFPALIQRRGEIESFLDTAWWGTMAWGLCVSLVLLVGARPLAAFFHDHSSYRIFWLLVPLVMLHAAQTPALALLYRRMQFHIELVLTIGEVGSTLLVGVPAIFIWRDWRGVLVAAIAGQAARTALGLWYFPYRPAGNVSWRKARELFKFGGWVTATNSVWVASARLDNVFVAHLLGPGALGYYQMAFRMAELPVNELAQLARQVLFPIVAHADVAKDRRSRMFLWAVLTVVAIGSVYALILVQWGSLIVTTVLGKRWLGAAQPLRWLAIYGLFDGTLIMARAFLDGMGKPAAVFKMASVRTCALVALIYPLTAFYGLKGAAIASVIAIALPTPWCFLLFAKSNADHHALRASAPLASAVEQQ